MKKVSVIIPVYNSEKYLKECLDSIIGQTLTELEIICINDGSNDDSPEILAEFAKEDTRIRIINQENKGASAARNIGASQAEGKYLYFMDSDDVLEKDALGHLFLCAEEKRLDILYFDGESFFETEELEEKQKHYTSYYIRMGDYSEVTSGPDLFRRLVSADEYRVSPCLQFLRREFYEEKKLHFFEGIEGEDNIFTCQSMLAAERVSHIKDRFFHRRVRDNSIMTKAGAFRSVYGFFEGFMEIGKIFCNNTLKSEEQEALAKVLDQRLKITRQKYQELDEESKKNFCDMDFREKTFFQLTVKEYDDALCGEEELRKKYKQVCQDKTERGIEIHELRREKQERGNQIRELKKEISRQERQVAQQQKKIASMEQDFFYRTGTSLRRMFRRTPKA